MRKAQFGVLLLLVGLMLSVIVACGGDTPTATAVPPKPTNTVAPATNTVAPATNTVAAATNTTAPVATNTTAAVTDTPAAMMPGTMTPGGMAAGTMTPADMMGGTMTPGSMAGGTTTPGSTGAGTAASSAEMDLITQAYTATKDLKSFHFTLAAGGDVITQPVSAEGDYVAPDKAYMKGTAGGQALEQLTIGGKNYKKDASGKWTVSSAVPGGANPTDLTGNANIFVGLGSLLNAGSDYRNVEQVSMDGVTVTHFAGSVNAGKMLGSSGGSLPPMMQTMNLGTIEVWIDPSTKYIHKVLMNLDLGQFYKQIGDMMAGLIGTPGPGTPTATAIPASMKFNINMTVSKQNDPSVTVPAAPADAVPAATETPAAGMGVGATPGTTP